VFVGIGGTYTTGDGIQWVTGEAANYTAWNSNYPSTAYPGCMQMKVPVGQTPGQWVQDGCETGFNYVCEKDIA